MEVVEEERDVYGMGLEGVIYTVGLGRMGGFVLHRVWVGGGVGFAPNVGVRIGFTHAGVPM